MKQRGGLDNCSICKSPLTNTELLHYDIYEGICSMCNSEIQYIKDTIDENIKFKSKGNKKTGAK